MEVSVQPVRCLSPDTHPGSAPDRSLARYRRFARFLEATFFIAFFAGFFFAFLTAALAIFLPSLFALSFESLEHPDIEQNRLAC
jgi:hypothetical protein